MKMKQVAAILLSCLLAVSAIGCGSNGGDKSSAETNGQQEGKESSAETQNSAEAENSTDQAEEVDPFGGYDEPITLTTIAHQALTTACPEGVTLESNLWQELWKSKGINVEYAAIAADSSDVGSKVNLAIASGEIPDFMEIGYATYKELLDADMLYDLTDVFEQYATEDFKNLMYADGGVIADSVTVDGRLYGIVKPADYIDLGVVVAIRTDWMEELGMDAPENLTELWDLAKAFKDNKMGGTCTIGIGATKDVNSGPRVIKNLIGAFGGKISSWIEKDGELVYGLLQPETKAALSALHDKYAEGLLDPEYGTKTEQQLFEDAVAGRSGIVLQGMTAPFYLDNGIELGQEWGYFSLYKEDGSLAETEVSVAAGGCVAVSKECKNPEAVIKLFNMYVQNAIYDAQAAQTYSVDGINNLSYPAIIYESGVNNKIYEKYQEFLATGEEPETVPGGYEATVEICESWRVDNDSEGRTLYNVFGPDGTQRILSRSVAEGGYFISAFKGAPGEASTKYGGNLSTLSEQMITNIITGAEPVDSFDEFVELWKANGGDEITKEVNEWYQESK